MKLKNDKKILIVGLGLLGGSYARALTEKGFYVSAITRSDSSIEYALREGIIAAGSTKIDEKLIGEADIIVFALYPHIFKEWVKENGHLIKKGAILTDVTGVKGNIVYEIQALLPEGIEFISAHPMAGREVYGVENSTTAIFNGANYIVVPTEKNSAEAIELCSDLGWTLGFADVSVLTPERHDEMIAFLSQLTHCIAVSLMCASSDPDLTRYTGDSFRDLTRIARINENMWSELFLENREALLLQMDAFRESFDKMYASVRDRDEKEMKKMMRLSTERRALFDKKQRG
ncbi:MAG: prephenate dehydrogenase [Ruminococcaceae bacterium]|nr:prephenate dehydrogenase [Oscillospiraceae bacterium]